MFRLLFACLLAISLPATATTPTNWATQVHILDGSQASLSPETVGQWYPVVLVEPGAPYAVEIRNPLDERVKVIISIDGVNPLTGHRSTRADAGVVLDPGASKVISTWMPRKKSGPQPLSSPSAGDIHRVDVAFFREVSTRPMLMGNLDTPPTSINPDKWVPPAGTSFYPVSSDPEGIVHRRVGPGAPNDPR